MARAIKENEWLEFLRTVGAKKTTTVTYKNVNENDGAILSMPLDKLFELYGNLVLTGFTEDEALIIVTGIANNALNY
jgi:hypothetical protein